MRIIHILTDLDSPSIAGFDNIKSQLQNYLLEATDNYKFLLIIERHLKTLQTAKSFQTVSNMLPNLMQGLKTIWLVDTRKCVTNWFHFSFQDHVEALQ